MARKSLEVMLDELVEREGSEYTDDPKDSGGPTKYGVTLSVARAFGYKGDLRDMTREQAKSIFRERYWMQPRFDKVAEVSLVLAEELFDTGVNMGTDIAAGFLQRALNVLNRNAEMYPDVKVDGMIGKMTIAALKEYVDARGQDGITVLFRLLNDQQGVRYMELSEKYPKNEKYTYGWVLNRVV